jgi:3-oxoacyl-[acyl-carrier protein] reductase
MRKLRGKTAVVTGASRGIGREIATRLSKEGVDVTAVARDETLLATLVGTSGAIVSRPGDVTDEDRVNEIVAEHVQRHGRLDILINNAGIGSFGLLEDVQYAELRETLDVNVGGTFLFMKAALPILKRQGDGDIINVSSVVGKKGYAEQSVYGASKHAVLGLTKAAAVEAHPHGVRVRSICPGGVDTELIAKARPDLDRSGMIQTEEIAECVVFLLRMAESGVVDNLDIRRAGSGPWS